MRFLIHNMWIGHGIGCVSFVKVSATDIWLILSHSTSCSTCKFYEKWRKYLILNWYVDCFWSNRLHLYQYIVYYSHDYSKFRLSENKLWLAKQKIKKKNLFWLLLNSFFFFFFILSSVIFNTHQTFNTWCVLTH